ncbi:hypothetical protein R3P38DRAFT_2525026 [Favolaschia claudopus]|uniref:Uncharacterized protein n=1 Tax=Favolaschia claudopus TaxID=2862362 RepID=A0AAW0BSC4_9AGAR
MTSLYSSVRDTFIKTKATSLGNHKFGGTFDRSFDSSGIYGSKFTDESRRKFTANVVGEIGSEAEGTWLGAGAKNLPADKLPLTESSKPHRWILALRAPTAGGKVLRGGHTNSLATLDEITSEDHAENNNSDLQSVWVTDWVKGGAAGDVILLQLPPTYEVKSAGRATNKAPRTPNRRTRVSDDEQDDEDEEDENMEDGAQKVGDVYSPSLLENCRGDYFDFSPQVKLVQRNIIDEDGDLVAPHELRGKLTEGTLVYATISLKSFSHPGSRTYHIYVESLKILDSGLATPWSYDIPELPAFRKRARNSTPPRDVSDAFNAFESPSPNKKTRTQANA